MGNFLLKRAGQSAVLLLVMSMVVFMGVFAIGNPIDILSSPQATQEEIRKTIEAFGLDQPLWVQYQRFLWDALHGNLGKSFANGTPAILLIFERMPATMELAGAASLLAIVIGLPLGLCAGLKAGKWQDKLITTLSITGFSLPTFWLGLMLVMVFSVDLGWLPSSGRGETQALLGVQVSFLTLDGIRHLILPAITLSLLNIAMVIRLTRAGTQEAMLQDYIKFARAKGLSNLRIVGVHVAKNILIPIVTVVALQLGSTIAFAIVTETIYAWPGMGKLIIDSIQLLDRPVIVAYLLVIVCIFVTINIVVDCAYYLIDPRVTLDK